MMYTLRPLLPALAVGLLAACSQPSAPAPRASKPAYDVVAVIRAAGQQDRSSIEVAPLRDPAVQHLLDAAHADEAARRYRDAADKLDQAVKQSPQSPDLLQDRAELAVRLGDYAAAERMARRSFAMGPKLGSLCARNWQTVIEMRKIAGDAASVASAKKSLAQCHVAGPVRM
jgi:tetratricopeptide (TPR) repeat protein